MPERASRVLALVAAMAAVVGASLLFRSGAGSTVATTAPLPAVEVPAPLAEATVDPTPRGFVHGFTAALNADDFDGVLANLNPEVRVLYMPGVAGIENPSVAEVREAFESYRSLDATLAVDECVEQPGFNSGVLDCTLTYNSNFARDIGLRDPHLFMRFVVGATGIDAMYLSPFVFVDDE